MAVTHPSSETDETVASDLPRLRFVDRFEHDGQVFYVEQQEASTALYAVAEAVSVARSIVRFDSVLVDTRRDDDGAEPTYMIGRPEYEPQYGTVDVYHWNAGRIATIRAERILDEPAYGLTEVDRA